jgi:hypothetical protein
MSFQDRIVNLKCRFLGWSSHVEAREESIDSWINSVSTCHNWRNTANKLSVNNFSKFPLTTSLIELESTDEELAECQRLLCSICVDFRHVHIINENDHLFASCFWSVVLESSLVNVLFDDVLEV